MQQIEFRAMGCRMLAVIDAHTMQAAAMLAQVPGWFAAWEQQLSRFRAGSELQRLNDSAGSPVEVSATLWDVIQVAIEAAAYSDGLVTPAVLDALEAAGYDVPFDPGQQLRGPTRAMVYPASSLHDWRAITLDALRHTVALPPGMRLDLGGVAKGWAAEQATRRLSGHGAALVDAGGDIALTGPRADGTPWPIGIADPRDTKGEIALLLLGGGSVATSGRDYRRWRHNDVWQHHIIDPRNGKPAATDLLSATVVAPTMVKAEAAAKTALILGSREGLAWIEGHPYLAALLVTEQGRVLQSRSMDEYLWKE